ncbi:hypothetical protein Tco_1053589 [Tanacetum coccineum]|uniref:Uncharacterized protein n=1 Tax=Tanacetum coccineum TaxID=301880 RepID=A0ABQ5GUB8_9ASTR
MANLSRNGSDALTEVHNQDNLNCDLFNQSEQIMTSSEQSNDDLRLCKNLKKQDNSDSIWCITVMIAWKSLITCVFLMLVDGNACPLTRINTTNEVPSRKPVDLDSESPKPVVKLVYSRKPRKNKIAEFVSKTKVLQPMSADKKEPSKSWGSTNTNIPSTSLNECRLSKLSSEEPTSCKDNGFGSYQFGRGECYYLKGLLREGLGPHNLFSVGQSVIQIVKWLFVNTRAYSQYRMLLNLLRDLDGDNLYTLSIGNMMASYPICLLSKASKPSHWLWHRSSFLFELWFSITHLAKDMDLSTRSPNAQV